MIGLSPPKIIIVFLCADLACRHGGGSHWCVVTCDWLYFHRRPRPIMFLVNRNYRMSVSNVGLKRQEAPFARYAIRTFSIKAHSTAPSTIKLDPQFSSCSPGTEELA
jgi:hypothetical protein